MSTEKQKGFIFTFDALLAVSLLILFLLIISSYDKVSDNSWQNPMMQRVGVDVFNRLNDTNIWQTYDKNVISSEIAKLVPNNVSYRVIVNKFERSDDNYNLIYIITIGSDLPKNKSYVKSKFVFLNFYHRKISNYGIVEIYTWQ